jgi:hypothetical protein
MTYGKNIINWTVYRLQFTKIRIPLWLAVYFKFSSSYTVWTWAALSTFRRYMSSSSRSNFVKFVRWCVYRLEDWVSCRVGYNRDSGPEKLWKESTKPLEDHVMHRETISTWYSQVLPSFSPEDGSSMYLQKSVTLPTPTQCNHPRPKFT